MGRIRILLVDDHESVRKGLDVFLGTCADMEVVGEADHQQNARQLCRLQQPDVLLVDIELGARGNQDGIALVRAVHVEMPRARALILSGFVSETLLEAALEAGAAGYLVKNVTVDFLAESIRRVAAGERVLCPSARLVYQRLYPGEPF
ncbi:MAG: response regulator transcription factor [Anaerolineae bacterium]|nr:response regulator transcription factor [Anaerolineae bacterium]